MASNKKPKKKYTPKPVYYPNLVIGIHAFTNFEEALDKFLATGEVQTDEIGNFIYVDNGGVTQSFRDALMVYTSLIHIYGTRVGKVFDYKPLTILQNRMFERRGFDEEEFIKAKECLKLCREIVSKIPGNELRNIMLSTRTLLNIERSVKSDLKTPELLLSYLKVKAGDLSYEEVIEKDKNYQQLCIDNPEDTRLKELRDFYMEFVSAYRFSLRSQQLD